MENRYSSRSLLWVLVNVALVIVILFGLFGIGALIRHSNAVVSARVVTVSGEGKTTVTPDVAMLSFAVVSQGSNPQTLQEQNTEKINKAVAFVKSQGVADADIKTTAYNLYPRYRYDQAQGESSISGYEINQTVTIKIRVLGNIGKIVGGLPAAGINQINSLEYSLENPEAQRDKAREEAFKNAYQKAAAMAQQNRVRLARVISFSESGDMGPVPPMYYERMANQDAKGMGGGLPNFEPGSEEVTIRVSVVYEIR
jgi:uncharacterized protein